MTYNAATYRFQDIRFLEVKILDFVDPLGDRFLEVKILDFVDPLGDTALKRGEDMSWTDMYHYAKFHADRCHRRRDIYNQTHTENYSRHY